MMVPAAKPDCQLQLEEQKLTDNDQQCTTAGK
jgi:hypothetical protein